jgi:hypothetical protein
MLSRKPRLTRQKRAILLAAKAILKERGWTYRLAGPVLNVHYTHLCLVLVGIRDSRALLKRIDEIPHRNGDKP